MENIEVGSRVQTTYSKGPYSVVAEHDTWFALVPDTKPPGYYAPYWVTREQVVLHEDYPKFEIGKDYMHKQSCVIVRCVGLCEDNVWLQSYGCYTVKQSDIKDYKLQRQ